MGVSGAAGEDDVMKTWKREVLVLFAVGAVVVLCLFLWALNTYQRELVEMEDNGYGINFEKICMVDLVNDWQTSLWYDRSTGIVYIVYAKSMTPYMMLDSFGCMTVGVFDEKTGMINPAEFTDDGYTVEMRGQI